MLKNSDSTVKNYIKNFIKDFINISSETLETHFKVVKRVPIEKSHFIKSYHKSEKNRNQVINQKLDCFEKIFYLFKGKPRKFYKKF